MAFDGKFWSSGFALPLPFGQAPESQQWFDHKRLVYYSALQLDPNDVARFQARVLSQIPVSKKPIEPIVYVQIDEWEIERG